MKKDVLSKEQKERLRTLGLLLSGALQWDYSRDSEISMEIVGTYEEDCPGEYDKSKIVETIIILQDPIILKKDGIILDDGYSCKLSKRDVYLNGVLTESSPIDFDETLENVYWATIFDDKTEKALDIAYELDIIGEYFSEHAIKVAEDLDRHFDGTYKKHVDLNRVEKWYKKTCSKLTGDETKNFKDLESKSDWEWQVHVQDIKPMVKFSEEGYSTSPFDSDCEHYTPPTATVKAGLSKNGLTIFTSTEVYFKKNKNTREWETDWNKSIVEYCNVDSKLTSILEVFTAKETIGVIDEKTREELEGLVELVSNFDNYNAFSKVREILIPLLWGKGIDGKIKAVLQ